MDNQHFLVWNNCLKIIRDNVPSISFRTWFEPIVPLKVNNNILTIQVPSPFFYEYLEEQYIDILSKTLRKELGNDAKLEYNVVMENNGSGGMKPYTVRFPGKSNAEPKNREVLLPLDNGGNTIKNPFVIPGIKKVHVDPQLCHDKTFSNFVEGDCNRLARSAGTAVAKKPGGTAFNPLFLYSDNGLGKTHLAQAIGMEVKDKYPEKTVLYVDANKFTNQYVEASRNNNRNDFLHFYQLIDVLIIDDVQDFAGKEKTQDVFFHIFNHLHQSGKQLVLTSDKPPVELQGMEKRLLSRFKWGLSADMHLPDLETRVSILKKKVYNDGIEIPPDVLETLATHITTNVRELEGALINLLAQSTLNRREITNELARQVIDRLVKNSKRELSISQIQKIVCDHFNIHIDLLQEKTRKREIVQARQVAMYFSKSLTKSSLASIGSQIGGKDHATVLHACKTVNNLMETDKRFNQSIQEIQKKLKV